MWKKNCIEPAKKSASFVEKVRKELDGLLLACVCICLFLDLLNMGKKKKEGTLCLSGEKIKTRLDGFSH